MIEVKYQSEIKNLHYLGLVTVSCWIKAVWICSVAGLVYPFIGGWNFQVQQCLLKSNSHGNNLSLNILAQKVRKFPNYANIRYWKLYLYF